MILWLLDLQLPKQSVPITTKEKFEDTKMVIRSRKSKKNRQYNVQKKIDKQRSTKHYTGN
jgi:tRNA A-37 threonylcarbamoyl transferase component Bud32